MTVDVIGVLLIVVLTLVVRVELEIFGVVKRGELRLVVRIVDGVKVDERIVVRGVVRGVVCGVVRCVVRGVVRGVVRVDNDDDNCEVVRSVVWRVVERGVLRVMSDEAAIDDETLEAVADGGSAARFARLVVAIRLLVVVVGGVVVGVVVGVRDVVWSVVWRVDIESRVDGRRVVGVVVFVARVVVLRVVVLASVVERSVVRVMSAEQFVTA